MVVGGRLLFEENSKNNPMGLFQKLEFPILLKSKIILTNKIETIYTIGLFLTSFKFLWPFYNYYDIMLHVCTLFFPLLGV